MANRPSALYLFLTLSGCRVREHYRPKLLACLEHVSQEQLWHIGEDEIGRPVGAIVNHVLAHLNRHTAWIRNGEKVAEKLEDVFPISGEPPPMLRTRVEDVMTAWDIEIKKLAKGALETGTLPPEAPDEGSIYHLVEHVSYHLGQIVLLIAKATRHEFSFCQRGINEAALSRSVQTELDIACR